MSTLRRIAPLALLLVAAAFPPAYGQTKAYPLLQQQGLKLVGTGATGSAAQGQSVAISADGNTAIVGGPNDNSNAGGAWIFKRSGSTWTQQGAELVGTGATGAARQGKSVAISGDGTTVIIGGPGDNSNAGAVWIFICTTDGGWIQYGTKLVRNRCDRRGRARNFRGALRRRDDRHGRRSFRQHQCRRRVGLDQDRDMGAEQNHRHVQHWRIRAGHLRRDFRGRVRVPIGGPGDSSNAGAVWVFTRTPGGFVQQAKVTGSGESGGFPARQCVRRSPATAA